MGATIADWQQDDTLSIGTSEEVGKQELAFPSEDVESDSTSPAVKLFLSAELLPLIKRTTAVLQVPWSIEDLEHTAYAADIAPRIHRKLHNQNNSLELLHSWLILSKA
ncbi:UNVERIFIED_CONTAM: hypothetical protein FKN15_040074 [Acipenser sinensis]